MKVESPVTLKVASLSLVVWLNLTQKKNIFKNLLSLYFIATYVFGVSKPFFPTDKQDTFVFGCHQTGFDAPKALSTRKYRFLKVFSLHLISHNQNAGESIKVVSRETHFVIYYEIIYFRWTFNFVYFKDRAIHEFKIPTKYLVILHIIRNPRI